MYEVVLVLIFSLSLYLQVAALYENVAASFKIAKE